MELKEIIKILKNNFKILIFFAVFGGLIAAGVVFSQPVKYRGDFVIYLNKEAPVQEIAQNYNDFYALQSLSQAADFLVEWSKNFYADRPEIEFRLKKKTALFLEGSLSPQSGEKTKEFYDEFVNSATQQILYFNNGIFAESQIAISFSDFKITEVKINFWRYLGAGVFGGLIIGIFAVLLKYYFKD